MVAPWSDQLQMAKSQPETAMSEAEEMSFQITPFVFLYPCHWYLLRDIRWPVHGLMRLS